VPNGPRGFNGDDEDDNEEPSDLGAAATLPAGPAPRTREKRPRRWRFPARTSVVVVIVALVLLALVPAFASGLKKTPRDRVGISYGGGPVEGSHYQRIVRPGHGLYFNGFFDPLYLYPSDQQSYIVSKNPNEGSTNTKDSIVAPTKDRVQVEYQIAAYFKLDTDRLRHFHEQLGLRYSAYTGSGWNNLIANTFRQQIENALQQETRRYNVAEIFGDDQVLLKLQADVQTTLSQRLIAALGEQYFCGPTFQPGGECPEVTFVIKKVDLPKSVVSAFEAERNSEIAVQTEENNTARRQVEAQGVQQLEAAGVTGEDYVLLKAIESGSINFWVLPTDSGVTLQSPTTAPAPGG
jgi:regulator of protease activity HflC (stomatin/prohibitin superfamily)